MDRRTDIPVTAIAEIGVLEQHRTRQARHTMIALPRTQSPTPSHAQTSHRCEARRSTCRRAAAKAALRFSLTQVSHGLCLGVKLEETIAIRKQLSISCVIAALRSLKLNPNDCTYDDCCPFPWHFYCHEEPCRHEEDVDD